MQEFMLWCASRVVAAQDAEVARQYLENYDTWAKTARFWTESYATPRAEEGMDEKVEKLCAMGFEKEAVRKALDGCGGDEQAALMALLG